MSAFRYSIFVISIFVVSTAYALNLPSYDGFVTDLAGVLTSSQKQNLESSLEAYRQETSNEIAVLIVPSLEGEVIADLAVEVGREWGIGTEEHNNGILLLIAIEDRELFIATGYGLEGAVPDIVAKGIIDEEIVPQFRNGDYYAGVQAGIEALKKHIGGEYTADRYSSSGSSSDWSGIWIFIVIIGVQILAAVLGSTKSWWMGGVVGGVFGIIITLVKGWWVLIPLLVIVGLIFDFIVSKMPKGKGRGGRSFWSGGGRGGSGGFGGFSGGSFGGGGAGGSW